MRLTRVLRWREWGGVGGGGVGGVGVPAGGRNKAGPTLMDCGFVIALKYLPRRRIVNLDFGNRRRFPYIAVVALGLICLIGTTRQYALDC